MWFLQKKTGSLKLKRRDANYVVCAVISLTEGIFCQGIEIPWGFLLILSTSPNGE